MKDSVWSLESYVIDEKEFVKFSDSYFSETFSFLPLITGTGWRFITQGVSYLMNSMSVVSAQNIPVHFDLGLDEIILPESWADMIPISVSLRTDVGLQFTLEGDRKITIPVQQLRDPRNPCRLGISFGSGDEIRLGRHFLNSLTGMVLDAPRNRIGFGLPKKRVPVARRPQSLIPRFHMPEMVVEDRLAIVVKRRPAEEGGLIIQSVQPRSLDAPWSGFYYELLREKSLGPTAGEVDETQLTQFILGAARRKLRLTPTGDLMLNLYEPQTRGYTIWIQQSLEFVRLVFREEELVTLTPPPSFEELDLPSPRLRVDAPMECCICQGAKCEDFQFQAMRGCTHWFHRECVKEWLATGNLSCPICRSVVNCK